MRSIYATTGALMVVVGIVAMITGEFAAAGSWLLALSLAAVGLAGLLSTVATRVSRSGE